MIGDIIIRALLVNYPYDIYLYFVQKGKKKRITLHTFFKTFFKHFSGPVLYTVL